MSPARTIALIAILVTFASLTFAQETKEPPKTIPKGTGTAISFPDIRTVVVQVGPNTRRYRLMGVKPFEDKEKDSPETLKSLLENQTVRIEADPELGSDPDDGIPLAYLYRQSDNLLINRELITQGRAMVDLRWRFAFLDPFLDSQKESRAANHGYWDAINNPPPPPVQQPRPAPAPPELVPDPQYKPSSGDKAILYDMNGRKGNCWLATNIIWFDEMAKAGRAGDTVGIQELMQDGRMELVPTGTPVLVLEYHDYSVLGKASACEVRILDGEFRDKAFWCFGSEVVQLIPKPKPTPPPLPRRFVRPRRR